MCGVHKYNNNFHHKLFSPYTVYGKFFIGYTSDVLIYAMAAVWPQNVHTSTNQWPLSICGQVELQCAQVNLSWKSLFTCCILVEMSKRGFYSLKVQSVERNELFYWWNMSKRGFYSLKVQSVESNELFYWWNVIHDMQTKCIGYSAACTLSVLWMEPYWI
jgi:hypothetical protein